MNHTTWCVEDSTKSDEMSEKICKVSFEPYFLLPSRHPPRPFVRINLQMDQINFEAPATDSVNFVDLTPAKNDIFELIHGILHRYTTGIDETAHLVRPLSCMHVYS